MVADFHNDFITDENFSSILDEYKKSDNIVVGAVFKGKRTFDECYRLAKLFTENKSPNLYLAYEDFTFIESFKILELLLDFKLFYVTCNWNGDSINGGGAVSYCILLMNLFVPLIDRYIIPKPFGYERVKKAKKEAQNG